MIVFVLSAHLKRSSPRTSSDEDLSPGQSRDPDHEPAEAYDSEQPGTG